MQTQHRRRINMFRKTFPQETAASINLFNSRAWKADFLSQTISNETKNLSERMTDVLKSTCRKRPVYWKSRTRQLKLS